MADPRYSYQFTADAPPLAFPVSQGYAPVDYVPPALPTLELNQLLFGEPLGTTQFGTSGVVEQAPTVYDYDTRWRDVLAGLGAAGAAAYGLSEPSIPEPTNAQRYGSSERYYTKKALDLMEPSVRTHFNRQGIPPAMQPRIYADAITNRPDLFAENYPDTRQRAYQVKEIVDTPRNEARKAIKQDLLRARAMRPRAFASGTAASLGLMALMGLLNQIDRMPDIPEDIVE